MEHIGEDNFNNIIKVFISNDVFQKLEVLDAYFEELTDLKGKYYECIYDEKKKEFDINKPHYHKIYGAWRVDMPDYIFDGIALRLKFGIIFGVKHKDITEITKKRKED